MNPKCIGMMWMCCIILFLFDICAVASRLEFKNIKCTNLDRKFSEFEECYLKAQNRTYKYMSIKVILHQKPVTQFKVNFELYKRSNGLQPISYNTTLDGCKEFSSARNPVTTFFLGLFQTYSNINHSCPYNHDLILHKLPTNFVLQQFSTFLPFPPGDYVLSSNWIAYGINRANVRVHATLI
ncbi:uncharacterized protein LOC111073519 [Drosophila obscura]|uniref:uncharacterized protein LOC111073519 n=1 Tax=Drosophila obscura TaxID=7282 RepID=UPI001BB23839|nr:uncharacterized protein LOC111073519 [Drosophila obscura]